MAPKRGGIVTGISRVKLALALAVVLLWPQPTRAVGTTLADGLTHFWALEEGYSSSPRADMVGGYPLTNNNTVGDALGKVGGASVFVRANSEYLSYNAFPAFGGDDFTIAFWVYLNSVADVGVLSFPGVDVYGSDGSLEFVVSTADIYLPTETSAWLCYAIVQDATANEVRVAFCGADALSEDIQGVTVTPEAAYLGRNGDLYMNGRLDQVAIWDRVLTPAELRLYAQGLTLAEMQAAAYDDIQDGFVIVPDISFGEGGIITLLVFLAGLELTRIGMTVAAWLRQSFIYS